jgi:TonB-linked SusC/RagA family outer membrane protein
MKIIMIQDLLGAMSLLLRRGTRALRFTSGHPQEIALTCSLRSLSRLTLSLGLWAMSTWVIAQSSITGMVRDRSNSEAIIGATITEKGTTNATLTDENGAFMMKLSSPNATLVTSYIGYGDIESIVTGPTIEILIGESSEILDQVVVVGYGVQRKSDLTGSVGSLKGKDLERVVTPNVEQALQGKLAGVYVTPNSGQPGAGATIRIRGTGTLNNANPLYVIDGMIAQDASTVNPLDVESVEVLKDASAAAIYGSRGANGVILITTKKGKVNKEAQISVSSTYGTQEVIKTIEMLSGAEFARAYNQLTNRNFYKNIDSIGTGTDWQQEVFQTAPQRNIQFGTAGGSETVMYNLSANLFNQEGVIKNTSYDRATVRFNTELKLKPWFKIGNNASYSHIKEQLGPNVVIGALRIPSVVPVTKADGKFSDPTFFGLALGNPAADQFYKSNHYKNENVLLGNIYGELDLFKYFKFKSNFGYLSRNFKQRYVEPKFAVSASQLNLNDRLTVAYEIPDRNWIWEQTLNFFKEWRDQNLSVLVGYTAEERKSEFFNASREGFPGTADELILLGSGNDTTQMNNGGASDEALVSILFRTNYALRSRYLFTASMRIDQSSRFSPDNRTGYFPSASIGWNAGLEPFIESLRTFDRLKLRASYGILGNQALSDRYPTAAIIFSGQNAVFGTGENLNQGSTQLSLNNPNLKWEVSRQIDFGLEAGFLGDRLGVEIDWYRRHTEDIIAAIPVPDFLGSQNNPLVNTAAVLNRGWDIAINWRQAGDFSYNFGVNLSPVHNEVVALAPGKSEIFDAFINGEPASRTVVGQPIGGFFGYKSAGVILTADDPSPRLGNEGVGDLKYQDVNNDGKLNGLDRTYLGSPIPTLTYGANASANYKNIDFAIDFLGVHGNKVYNEKEAYRFAVYNWEKHVADAWTQENPSTSEPRVTNGGHNYIVSDRFIQDGSFFRLRSISLGYTAPTQWTQKIKIQSLRIFALANNIYTAQAFTGYNPEFPNASSPFRVGFDGGSYPITRSIQGGIEFKF